MNATERGDKVKHMVNAIYTALDAEGLLIGRMPQSAVKTIIAGAVAEVAYPTVTVDTPSWGNPQ